MPEQEVEKWAAFIRASRGATLIQRHKHWQPFSLGKISRSSGSSSRLFKPARCLYGAAAAARAGQPTANIGFALV